VSNPSILVAFATKVSHRHFHSHYLKSLIRLKKKKMSSMRKNYLVSS